METDDDQRRVWYIDAALAGLHEAIERGVPVLGYFHWTLLDNFEWIRGYTPKMGLVAVDRTTFVRTPKPSAAHLGEIARRNAAVGITDMASTSSVRPWPNLDGCVSIRSPRRSANGAQHGWPEQAPGMAVVTSIMRLQQIFLARADAVLRPLGLTFARYEVLMLLSFSRQGALPLGKIGERLQVNAASVTNAVDRLEADGLVTRRSNPDDGRGTLARLTAAGRRRRQAATDAMNEQVFTDIGVPPSTVSQPLRRCWRSSGGPPATSRRALESSLTLK